MQLRNFILRSHNNHLSTNFSGALPLMPSMALIAACAAERIGEMVAVHIIPRPHVNVDQVLPLGRTGSTG